MGILILGQDAHNLHTLTLFSFEVVAPEPGTSPFRWYLDRIILSDKMQVGVSNNTCVRTLLVDCDPEGWGDTRARWAGDCGPPEGG